MRKNEMNIIYIGPGGSGRGDQRGWMCETAHY